MILEAKNLMLCRGGRAILKGFSATVRQGSFTVLLGPNGCGKSTFLSAVSGMLPYQGEILLKGRALRDYSAKERASEVAIVPQIPARAGISVTDLITLGRMPHRTLGERLREQDLQLIEDAIVLFDLQKLRNANLDRLSGGELRRAYIAMAAAQDAPLLMLDEPDAHLDEYNRHKIMEILHHFNQDRGKTVLVVTHDIADAVRYANEIILMKDGRSVGQDAVESILKKKKIESLFGVERYVGEIWGIQETQKGDLI